MMMITAYHIHQWSLIIILLCCNNSSNFLVVTAWQQRHHHHRLGPLLQFDQSTTTTTSIICRQWKHQRRSICFSYLRESKRPSLPLQLQQQQQDDNDMDNDHYELSDHHKEQHHHHRQRRGLRLMHGIRRTFQRVFGAVVAPFHKKKDAALISSSSSSQTSKTLQSSSSKVTTTTVVTPSSSAAALTQDYERFDQHLQQQQRGYFHWIRRILHRVYGAMTAPFKKKHALSSHSSVPTTSSSATATASFDKDKGGAETIAVAPAVNGAAKTNNTVFDEKVLPRLKETARAAVDGTKTNNTALIEKDATARYGKKDEEVAEVNGFTETFNMATPQQGSTQNTTTTASSSHRQPHYHHQPPSPPPPPPLPPQQQRRHASGNEIVVTSSLELPIDAYTAFDAFSDLPRQSSWSPWLHSVEYIHDDSSNNNKRSHHKQQHRKHRHPHDDQDSFSLLFSQESPPSSSSLPPSSTSSPITAITPLLDHPETRWTASFRGFRFSWDAIHTRLERPILIEWESTSGLKNYGQVVFVPNYTAAITPDTTTTTATSTMTASPDVVSNCYPTTLMTLSITFRPPTWLAFLMRSSEKATKFVEERMLRTTLQNFRQALLSEQQLLQEEPPQQQQYERATIQNMVETSNT